MGMVAKRDILECREVEPLLGSLVDGELQGADRAPVEGHLLTCPSCRVGRERLLTLKATLSAAAATTRAPDALFAAIARDLDKEERLARRARQGRVTRAAALTVFLGLGAAGLVVAGLGMRVEQHVLQEQHEHALIGSALERHALDVPVDVASPDPVRVEAFLKSRVGVVRVPRLDRAGFALLGGRVVDIDRHRAAQLVYAGGLGQRLSLLALPDPDGTVAGDVLAHRADPRHGADAVEVWAKDGALYSLVGDLDAAGLHALALQASSTP